MKFSINRLAFIIGTSVIALVAIDALIQMNNAAFSDFGFGQSQWVTADSAAAIFMIGLIMGVIVGIGTFFAYIVWREKKYNEEPNELDTLLAEIAQEEKEEEENALFIEENRLEEQRSESTDPWERGADWWKNSEDDN